MDSIDNKDLSSLAAASEVPKVDLDALEEEYQKETYRRRFAASLRSTIFTVITVFGIAVLIASLWMPVLQVYGTSMNPSLQAGDIVLCSRGGMKRGNVVAFYCSNKILTKRVIGEQGDTIDIDKSGNVTVNGSALDEPYVKEKMLGECNVKLPCKVPENRIFVLSDDRSTSSDSRSEAVGCVTEEDMVGKLVLRVWPLNRFGLVH